MTATLTRRAHRPTLVSVAVSVAVAATLLVAGCSTPKRDESAGATAERLYREARDDMAAGSYDRAIKTLERVEGLAAGALLAQQAQLDMAYLHWKTGERTPALTTIERFIKLNPSSPALDYALYLRGLINFNDNLGFLGSIVGQDLTERDQRAMRDAYQAFRQLVDQFPQSGYAPDARLRMNYILDSLAAHEVHVARYYLRRGAYLAAANRAQVTVAEFQQSRAAEEALHIMVQAYDKLQLTQLRDDAARVLRQNFPNSAFLGGAGTAGGSATGSKPWWRFW